MTELTGMADGMDRIENAHDRSPAGMPVPLPVSTPARVSLCFARTELGNQQVRRNQTLLPLHIARLLLLFEGPQTVSDLRQMIDEPWLPEALIELERRRLIHRITPTLPPSQNLLANAMQLRQDMAAGRDPRHDRRQEAAPAARTEPRADSNPGAGDAALERRRSRTRLMFLRQLGTLGTDMARRIDQCGSDAELDELMPQVDALIAAIAGRDALGQFRQQTTRSS